MHTRKSILTAALKRELEAAIKAADKAKAEADECQGITGELIAIQEEFSALLASKRHDAKYLAELVALKKRNARARRILAKDFSKLLDVQFNAEHYRDAVAQELTNMELRSGLMLL